MRDYASVLPVLLEADLFSAGWCGSLSPYPGISSEQFAMGALRRSLLKKFISRNTEEAANSSALELFLKINSECATWFMDSSSTTEIEAIALGEAKDFIYRFFYPDNENEFTPILSLLTISEGFGFGNGANIGVKTTDFLSKVGTSSLASTSSVLYDYFAQAISNDPIWSDLESIRLEHRGVDIVQGSRMSFVPKTTEISRTICTEPLLNMLFQQGIKTVLERRLRQVSGIDLTNQQSKNRALARLGSLYGGYGTIDLSSASDSMSLGLVREFFPSNVVRWLELTRSPVTTLPSGSVEKLHMVSSMGNAFTFPLQTVFFLCIVYGVYRAYDIPFMRPSRRSLGNFAVNGDDIIVEDQAYDLVCKLLVKCGFSVNVDKSFNTGLFRESCGRDYFHGRNVRGVYFKRLDTLCDRYSAINRLNVWSAEHGIPLPHTVGFLLKGTRFLPIPFDEDDSAGIKIPYRALRRVDRCRHTNGIKYRYYEPIIPAILVDDVTLQKKLRGWFNNQPAILLSALAGTLRSGEVVPRQHDRPQIRLRTRYSSSWDYIPFVHRYCGAFGDRLKSVSEINLHLS
jgi:hypothetical protein